eukprot:TRINITY_DN1270_c0_g1_i9.p1 TRINITY_DN1270_c0_g1~~TRINITY_DN1270_c0_g1_i9.p1  ORF type:complete len:340 (+),score=43.06 TRINITY_DN1270_c0_g1_i9:83-1102(+)
MCYVHEERQVPKNGIQRTKRRASCIRDPYGNEVYVLGKLLGAGQVGVVHECYDLATGEKLACKSIPGALLRNEVVLKNTLKEIELMQKMGEHSHVLDLRGVYVDSFGMHLIIDLCVGGDLFAFLAREQVLDEAVAAEMMKQIMVGLEHIHSQGIVHRDIKPENILLGSSPVFKPHYCMNDSGKENSDLESFICGPSEDFSDAGLLDLHLKLADFGLAMDINGDEGEKIAGFCGSPLYMAPEVIRGKPYSTEIDMWSAGVICFTALSGFMPFAGGDDGTEFDEILHLDIRSLMLDESWTKISADAKDFVLRLLCRDQDLRMSAQQAVNHPWIQRFCGGGA